MSRDIRSFFKVLSNKPKTPQSTKKIIDSDDENIIEGTPKTTKEHLTKKKPKVMVINSDSDDEPVKKKLKKKEILSSDSEDEKPSRKAPETKPKVNLSKLKPAAVADVFKAVPIKQSKVEVPKIEAVKEPVIKSESKKGRKNKNKTELGVHKDLDFEKTLLDLDDDFILENVNFLDKVADEASKLKEEKKSPNENAKPEEKVPKKRTRTSSASSSDKTPRKKKEKLDTATSGVENDLEKFERRRHSAMLYQKYLHRGGPKHHGEKEIPTGKPDCLNNLCFLRTGVLDSLDDVEFDALIKNHGGRTVHSVSKKVNYVVVGEDPGPSKLSKAEAYKIPCLTEDELLDLILTKSGKKVKYAMKDNVSEKVAKNETTGTKLEPVIPKNKSPKTETKHPFTSHKPETSVSVPSTSQNKTTKFSKVDPKISPTKPQTDQFLSLSDKYKPNDVSSIIGQQNKDSNMNKLKWWLQNWHRNQSKEIKKTLKRPGPWTKNDNGAFFQCALLSGPPGIGKTTTATLVARELDLDIVEMNASDTRSKRMLHEDVAQLLNNTTITGFINGQNMGKNRVLLMDEVDGMAGNEDRGGVQELILLIKNTNIPIICMCNDRNHQKIRSLANYCFDLRFNKPTLEQIRGAMMSVCFKEGMKLTPSILTEIIQATGCDIRQTLNHLTLWTSSDSISLEEAKRDSKNAHKDVVLGPFEVCRKTLLKSQHKDMSIVERAKLFFYDYSFGPLFIQENYLNVQSKRDKKDDLRRIAAAADSISYGDVIDAKIRGSNNWSLLDTQAMFASVFPGHFISGDSIGIVNFPGWLGKNSMKNKFNRFASSLQIHTRVRASASKQAIILEYLTPLRNAILLPLKQKGKEGISDAINVMKEYNLLREDLDNLTEMCQALNPNNKIDIDSNIKSSFTRSYNKEVQLAFAPNAVSKKKGVASNNNDLIEELLNEDEESENEDDVTSDAMIKVPQKATNSKKLSKTTKATKAESSSKKPSGSRGKLKTKK